MGSWITDILLMTLIIGILGWVIFLIYKGISKIFDPIYYFVVYRIFKRQYDVEMVKYCMENLHKGKNKYDIQKDLLFKGHPKTKIKETQYIFQKLRKIQKKEEKEVKKKK